MSLGLGFDLDRSDESAAGCAEGPVFVALGPLAGLLDPVKGGGTGFDDAGNFFDAESPSSTATGGYFNSTRKVKCEYCRDTKSVDALMALLDSYTE